jgi:hypothetical protein
MYAADDAHLRSIIDGTIVILPISIVPLRSRLHGRGTD